MIFKILIRTLGALVLAGAAYWLGFSVSSPIPSVRKEQIRKLDDQDALAEIAVDDGDRDVRRAAIGKLTDQETLAGIAVQDLSPPNRQAAAEGLTDQTTLARVALQDKDRSVRLAAIKRLTDQPALAQIAVQDDDVHNRKAAVGSLTDQAALADVATGDKDQAIRLAAVGRLTDQMALAKVGIGDSNSAIRKAAVAKLTDDDALEEFAIGGKDLSLRETAVDKLTDQMALATIAAEAGDLTVERRALAKLTDPTLVARISTQVNDPSLRRVAVGKRTANQMRSVVLIEGDRDAATGFVATVNDKVFVVTSLRVLANNSNLTVKTLAGNALPWQGVAGAVGADIALLRLIEPESAPAPLPWADDVTNSVKIGGSILVGNRLDATSPVAGRLAVVEKNHIELNGQFDRGDIGSPVLDPDTGLVLGIATPAETVLIDPAQFKTEASMVLQVNPVRWFAVRYDSVARWEAIDLPRLRAQMKRVEEFEQTSMALLAVLGGDSRAGSGEAHLRSMISHFEDARKTAAATDVRSPDQKTALFDDVCRDLISGALGCANEGLEGFAHDTYYDYFHSAPSWAENVDEQVKFRRELIAAFRDCLQDLPGFETRVGTTL